LSVRDIRPSAPNRHELLKALADARRLALLQASAELTYSTPLYRKANLLKDAIDAFAEEVTGEATYFHAKPHGGNWGGGIGG
jgi:hypothetical protein